MSGGLGGILGGVLGDVIGIALAPETGGLSLAIPAIGGALGAAGGNLAQDAITGQPINPLSVGLSALGGGAGGFGAAGGFGDVLGALGGIGGDAASGAAGAAGGAATDAITGGAGTAAETVAPSIVGDTSGAGPAFLGGSTPLTSVTPTAGSSALGGGSAAAATDPFNTGVNTAFATGAGSPAGGPLASLQGAESASQLSQLTGGATGEGGGLSVGGGNIATPATGAAPTSSGVPAATSGAPAAADTTGVLNPATFPSTSSIDFAASGGAGGPLSGTGPNAVDSGLFGAGGPLSGVASFLGANKNLIGPALLAGNIGKSLLGQPPAPGTATLQANSDLAGNIARSLAALQPNTSIGGVGVDVPTQVANQNAGATLTPAQQAASNQQLAGQIAAIKSKYAGLGMDPNGLQAQQDIAAAQTKQRAADAATIQNNQQLAVTAANTAGGRTQSQQAQDQAQANTSAATALTAINAANTPTIAVANQQLADDQALSEAIQMAALYGLFTPQASA